MIIQSTMPEQLYLFDPQRLDLIGKDVEIQNGHLGDITVEDIFALREQGKAVLGGQSDGHLPKNLANPPGFIGDVYKWILASSYCPQPMFALSAALTLTGTIVGQKVKSSLGQYPNIFAINIGKTSSGKEYPRQAVLSILDAADASHLWRSKVTSDAAIEAALAEQSNILVTIDEAGHFFKTANARGNNHANTIKPTLLELWSSAGKTWKGKQRARASGKPQKVVVVDNPSICFYGATQPEVFFGGITSEDIRDGWIPRNLFFFSQHQCRPQIKEWAPIPEDIVSIVKKWTNESTPTVGTELSIDCSEQNDENDDGFDVEASEDNSIQTRVLPGPIVVGITNDGKSSLNSFARAIFRKASSGSPFAPLYGKVVENTIRIALILAVSKHMNDPENAVISFQDIAYAGRLVLFLTMTMEDVFKSNLAENGTERQNKRLFRIIMDAGNEGITTSLLTSKSRWLSSSGRRKILDDLIESQDIREVPTQKGGSRFIALTDGSMYL